ncbi:MAG TPA: two-component regulator propeller domain-containing protein, partial [Terracidiphilus sp.]|nr:two-component regulator propeller domain-containing protein [Terracidiphilus sp.]
MERGTVTLQKLILRPIRIACFLLMAGVLSGFAAGCLAQRYSFREYRMGLSNLNITGIAQDRTGYLWAGTENGLYRYDGIQFLRFGSSAGVTGRLIQDLFV